MRPFFTTLTLTATVAAVLWWHQRSVIAGLQANLAARSRISATPADEKPAAVKPKFKKHQPYVALKNPDGSPLITSRSAMRGAFEAAKYVRTLSREALEKLLTGEEPDDMGEFAGLNVAGWARLGEMDPRAALALALGTHKKAMQSGAGGHNSSENGFHIVLHDWLIRDRAAALKWFHDQPDSEEKATFLMVAGFVLSASDPELLGQLSGSIADPALQQKSLVQTLFAQSNTDLDAAIARLSELKDVSSREEVLHGLMILHGDTRPRQLMELALPLALEGTQPKYKLSQLLQSDFNKNPADALAWLTSRSTAEVNALRAASNMPFNLTNIGSLDPAAVQAAVSKLEKSEDRDWIMANYHVGTVHTAPLAALQSVSSVADPALRSEAISHVLARTVRNGSEAELEPWIVAQPEKDQAEIRNKLAAIKLGSLESPLPGDAAGRR
jgi:hypothetical protein